MKSLIGYIRIALVTLIMMQGTLIGYSHFVLISAPGSGKGTFSQYMCDRYGYVQICPGDIFRNEIRLQTELGKKIQGPVERGEYVQEDITCNLVKQGIIDALSRGKKIIIDGFPRTVYSFTFLINLLREYSLIKDVCFLQCIVPDTLCIARIENRLVCTTCAHVYNTESMQPARAGVCDVCGTTLTRRAADTKDIAAGRVKFFHETAEWIIDAAAEQCNVEKLPADCALNALYSRYDELHNK